MNGVKVKKIVL